jgi:hypothetical protein
MNSGNPVEIRTPEHNNDSTFAIIEQPAFLRIDEVSTDKDEVDAGGSTREDWWYITVKVTNTGDAALQLVDDNLDSVRFVVNGDEQTDYDVRKPDGFEGNGTLVLNYNETDSLIFTVRKTGINAGLAEVSIYLTAFDKNVGDEPDKYITQEGKTSITILSVSSVRIDGTSVDSPNVFGGAAYVNAGQRFAVGVEVRTPSPVGADNIRVILDSDLVWEGLPDTMTISHIPEYSSQVTSFEVMAPEDLGGEKEIGVTLNASIDTATAHGSDEGAQIVPPSPGHATHEVYIQTSARLSLALSITPDPILTAGQEFNVVARVSNLGKASINDSGRIKLTPPSSYQIKIAEGNFVTTPVWKPFGIDEAIQFVIKAPDGNAIESAIVATIDTIPKDINTDSFALIEKKADTLQVSTYRSNVVINDVSISDPEGATDGILSTQQIFTVTASGTITTDLYDRKVVLRIPIGSGFDFWVSGDSVKMIQDGIDTFSVSWDINAPDNANSNSVTFTAIASGVTENKERHEDLGNLSIQEIDERAKLTLQSLRLGSSQIGENVVFAVNQSDTLRAMVKNDGEAKLTGTGRLKLDLGETGITLVNEAESVKDFEIGRWVEWVVQAPTTPYTIPRTLTVSIDSWPNDENTGARPVAVTWKLQPNVTVVSTGFVRVDDLFISSPSGAVDGTVSTYQDFTVKAVISSERAQNIKAKINYSSSQFSTESSIKNVTEGDSVEVPWEVKAPNEARDIDNIWITITAEDENWKGYSLSTTSDSIEVTTQNKTTFRINASITNPVWLDNRVSTGQDNFRISAWLEHEGAPYIASDSLTIKMTNKPPNYPVYETYEQTRLDTVHWHFDAPNEPSIEADIFTFELIKVPRDRNSGMSGFIEDGHDKVDVEVLTVNKASLSLNAFVKDTEPQSSTGYIWVGRQFDVATSLYNYGQAGFVDTYKVDIQLPANFALVSPSDTTVQSTQDSVMHWRIQAPETVSGRPDTVRFRMLQYPLDENSRDTALVVNDSANVIIILDRGKLAVSSYPLRDRKVVVRGGQSIPVLGLRLKILGAGITDTVQVKQMDFILKNNKNKPIAPNRALERIALVHHQTSKELAVIYELPDVNPIRFFSESSPFEIAGNSPDSIDVIVNIPRNASETDFRVAIDSSSAIQVHDPVTNTPVGIANEQEVEVTYLGIESDFSVLISDDFRESFCNYPNPFGIPTMPVTWFVYNLSETSDLELKIFTLTGDLVWTKTFKETDIQGQAGLHDGKYHNFMWDGKNGKGHKVVNGVYLAYLTVKKTNETAITKIAVVR